ncbi:MAG: hypothetical protein AUK47_22405 [Deltaproteobacteria bacterium CG2_30_63_29]|nr:MAG: hypothetical protein AUK47_22405 [Deltaproteobacteria bacterium CG2_30_63_29]PJB43031.1 MAG: hypothetical protein CO108_10730 [Deltaproteobacteria bacterium CG_4_9_14_3_um_filter_63_12]
MTDSLADEKCDGAGSLWVAWSLGVLVKHLTSAKHGQAARFNTCQVTDHQCWTGTILHQDAATTGVILIGVGGAMVVGGAVLVVLGWDDSEADAAVSGLVTPNGAAFFVLSGTF